jgi:hypothetical protein
MTDEPTDEPTADEPRTDAPTANEPPADAPAANEPPAEVATSAPAARETFTWSTGRVLGIVVIVLLLGAGAGLLIGRSTADTGPASLADAVHDTAKGDLPRGDLSVGDALGALGIDGNGKGTDLRGVLGNLFGKNGDSKDLRGLLGDLFDELKGDASGGGHAASGYAYLGVTTEDAPSGQSGARVVGVTAGSPAADAGLRADDVVTAVDGTAVAGPKDLVRVVLTHAPGDSVAVTYARDGQSTTVQVRLGNLDTKTTPSTAPSTTRGA